MKRSMAVLIVLGALLLIGIGAAHAADVAAPAPPVAEPTALAAAANQLMTQTVLPILLALFSGLATVVLNFFRKKLKLQLSAETESWIMGQAEHAVQYVAELAASKFKFNNLRLTGSDQLDLAIARLTGLVPKLSREDAEKYVMAALARIPGVGSTGDSALVSGGTAPALPAAAPADTGKISPEDIKAALGKLIAS